MSCTACLLLLKTVLCLFIKHFFMYWGKDCSLLCPYLVWKRTLPRPVREAKILQKAIKTMQETQIDMVSHIWFTNFKNCFDSLREKR